jgi:hypothetical protein
MYALPAGPDNRVTNFRTGKLRCLIRGEYWQNLIVPRRFFQLASSEVLISGNGYIPGEHFLAYQYRIVTKE